MVNPFSLLAVPGPRITFLARYSWHLRLLESLLHRDDLGWALPQRNPCGDWREDRRYHSDRYDEGEEGKVNEPELVGYRRDYEF